MISEEIDLQDFVSEYYANVRYKNKYSLMYHEALLSVAISLIKNDGLILDNGCGVGNLFEHSPNKNIIGIDISEGMLNKAKSRMVYVVRGDTEKLPFKNLSFDSVICKALLHHVHNKEVAIREMERVLRDGGELIVVEPIKTILSAMPRKMVKESKHFSTIHSNFKRDELIKLFGDRFDIKSVIYNGYIAHPLLGFPDVIDLHKYIPFKDHSVPILMRIDNFISKLPIINKQSWTIILRLTKKGGQEN
ncbi:MAG: class I SAM-dependent methyltransferase [Thermoplasmata archaeon]|nr:MAG: class I SAM-dependent methyltransferase [Thermoplasmata archaeon]